VTIRISLPAELTIYTVGALHPQWLACLDGGADAAPADGDTAADFCVDAAAAAELDAAGIQLLASLAGAVAARRLRLRLVDPSPALTGACAALGLSSLLADAAAAAGVPT
jgi:anti-anti-sigma regulatory factor